MKKNEGITLLVLVITIIILLILASISINMLTGENGIIKNTHQAKELTDIANEKEILQKSIVKAMGKDKMGDLKKETLQKQLDKENEKIDVIEAEENFNVIFRKSNRYYYVESNGNIGEPEYKIDDNNAGDITKGGELDGINKPYEINCIEDLVALSNMVNGTGTIIKQGKVQEVTEKYNFNGRKIILKRNLDFKSELSYQDSKRTDFGELNGIEDDGNVLINELITGKGFTPIGQEGIATFQGDFDGMNNKILNLYEKDAGKRMGLFGRISNVSIQNLYIQGTMEANTGISVGGISGGALGSDININNCTTNISINSKLGNSAGFIGQTWGPKINFINCINKGNINITQGSAGGFIGTIENDVNIENSCNLGNINVATIHGNLAGVSGFIGRIFSGNLNATNSFNIGNIISEGAGKRAGIVADVEKATNYITLNNVYNLGNIPGKTENWIAGKAALIGYTTNATITINNGFYIQKSADSAVYKKEDSEYGVTKLKDLKYSELITKINDFTKKENNSNWKLWKIGNDGYPDFT